MFGALTILVILGIAFTFIAVIVKNLLYVGRPDEVLIFAGTNRVRLEDKRDVGYRCIIGGRTIRKPFLEKIARLDLSNMNINVQVENAFSRGGIPVCVQGVANLKIASQEPYLGNAIERFLGKSRQDIKQIAKDTLEGNLRGVLATLTPEQVNEDKIAFAHSLIEEAEHDLLKLGLKLDSLKIQNVYDNVDYLNSLGRVRNAIVRQEARIAEARAKAEATIRSAENMQLTELQRTESQQLELRAEIERKMVDLDSRKDALIKQEVGQVKALIAKAEAEVKVQLARIERVKRELEADVVTPAKAHRDKKVAEAKAQAATILQQGKATAEAMEQMVTVWKKAGPNARDIFLMQKLEGLMTMIVSTIHDISIDRVFLLQTGEGTTLTKQLIGAAEQMRSVLGIDVGEVLKSRSSTHTGISAGTATDKTAAIEQMLKSRKEK